MFVQTSKILGLIVPENTWHKIAYALHLIDRWKMEKEGKINHSILCSSFTQDFNPL